MDMVNEMPSVRANEFPQRDKLVVANTKARLEFQSGKQSINAARELKRAVKSATAELDAQYEALQERLYPSEARDGVTTTQPLPADYSPRPEPETPKEKGFVVRQLLKLVGRLDPSIKVAEGSASTPIEDLNVDMPELIPGLDPRSFREISLGHAYTAWHEPRDGGNVRAQVRESLRYAGALRREVRGGEVHDATMTVLTVEEVANVVKALANRDGKLVPPSTRSAVEKAYRQAVGLLPEQTQRLYATKILDLHRELFEKKKPAASASKTPNGARRQDGTGDAGVVVPSGVYQRIGDHDQLDRAGIVVVKPTPPASNNGKAR